MFGMKLKSWMEAHLGRPKTTKTANTAASSKKVSKEDSSAPTPASSSASSNSELHVGISGTPSVSSGSSQGTVNAVQASSPEYLDDRRGSLLMKGSEGHNHINRDQVTRIGTVEEEGSSNCSSRTPQSNNNSGGILLGGAGGFSTTNNLSSPDTGYSTDGYSPKSVYPALSFESSGKSTPKSSYTISSLVSSELLHTSSTCSSSHKIPTTTSLSSGSVSIHVHLDGLERKMVEVVEKRRSSPGRQEDLIEGHTSSFPIKDVHVYSSSKMKRSDDNDSVKPSPSLNEPPSSFQYCGGPKGLETTNPFRELPSTKSASFLPPSGTGSNGPGTTTNHHLTNGESSGEPDSSSKVPKLRTSLGSSQITSESKQPSLLPVYSISSPRKERTKIKTNPWLPIFPHSNVQTVSHVNSKPAVIPGAEGVSSPVKCRGVCVEGEVVVKEVEEEEERLLRVSNSGGSDSGKGSLGTNRNSTESSVLLTDSPRNSIISHETPPDSDDTNTPSPHQQSRPGAHSRWTSSSPSPGLQSQPQPLSSSSSKAKKVTEEDEVKRVVTMVDKETDILSDWAPSDEEEEEEEEEEEDEEEGEETDGRTTTPTPSTPTDSRLPGGRSSSSDIDFGDSTASAATGISSLPPRSGQQVEVFFHPQPIQVYPKILPPGGGGGECSFFPIQTIHPRSPPHHHPPFAGLVYSDPSIDSDYLNANILGESVKSPPSSSSSHSQALARGALGFLRKIFKKTSSCSSQRTSSPGSERVRRFRKGRGEKEGLEDGGDGFVPMRSPLLTAESLLSSHPLVGRRAPLHPHHTFLTPTPNAFRRRSGGGGSGESGESKASSSGKSCGKSKQVKTDIIRLPGGPSHLLSPSSKGHRGVNNASSCSTTSSSENKSGGGVFCVSTLMENPYEGGGGAGGGGGGNSSGSSSLHSMSTSVSAASANLNGCRNSSHPGGFLPETFHQSREPKGPHHLPQGMRDFPPPPPPVGYAPSFNNYSPIHRLVVTGSNSSHFHPSESPLPPPRTVTNSSFHPPPPPQVMSTFTPTPHNRPLPPHHHLPPPTFSPLANHRPHPGHPPEGFLVSPSPILGNPRYQYIASSNQNSPLLNAPKRQGAPNYPHPPPSSFSPVPPPRSNPRTPNPFITPTSSPNPQQHFSAVRRGSVGCADVLPQQQQQNNLNANLLPAGRMNVLSRSHSYQQQQQQHYYASPNHQRPPLPPQQQPLLMRTHLHNQNIRLNNFLMNKQRSKVVRPRNSQSFHERIYESVDSEDEAEGMVSGDEEGGHEEYDEEESDCRRRLVEPPPPPRTKRPPVPMALFGPNTFLSETETRLLHADREADRKYKRLINEAEALLREISAVKSQQIHQQQQHQPWVSRSHQDDRFQMEECPQSDPLRRKAYDCWALRRLQQELAGCCASPPVLHRSRMNLQSPSTPTGNNGGQPYPVGLSLISHTDSSASRANNFMDNRTSGHF